MPLWRRAVSSTCTSESGFSLTEVVVGLAITLLLLAASVPLWIGVQHSTSLRSERLLDLSRWQVVQARLERDLRLARPGSLESDPTGLLLLREARRVVVLTQAVWGEGLEVVCWESAGGSLMRRRRPYDPLVGVGAVPGVFLDSKTMLEGLRSGYFTHIEDDDGVERSADHSGPGVVTQVILRVELSHDDFSATVHACRAGVGW